MNVRPALLAELDRCQRLDGAYSTSYVWQMEQTTELERVAVTFRRARVPRTVQVVYPRPLDDLFEDWRQRECFVVAEDAVSVAGFLDMLVDRVRWQGWIKHLLIHRPFRRQGVANLLLEAAERWGRGSELGSINITLQPKNDPAVGLLLKRGYAFRGYMDRYFANNDPGLIYYLDL
ncbi:MAG: GNAT family N-acetyltransferase [Chloroflexota bacterium]